MNNIVKKLIFNIKNKDFNSNSNSNCKMNKETKAILANYPYNSTSIDISNMNIKGIITFKKYPKLKILNCSGNKITELGGFTSNLENLICSHNQIKLFEFQIHMQNIKNIKNIDWRFNPLKKLYYSFNIYKNEYLSTCPELSSIYFCFEFNDTIDNLPSKLIELKFNRSCIFNYPVNNLPTGLKTIIFGNKFNQPVDNLPAGLEQIVFGECFSHPVYNLPLSIKKITFADYSISSAVECNLNNLPFSLEYLELGNGFNTQINNYPPNLKFIKFGHDFSQPIDNLPQSIKEIRFNCNNYYQDHCLDTECYNNIYYLDTTYYNNYYYCGTTKFNQIINCLPESLEKIIFFSEFNSPIKSYNKNLKIIEFGKYYNQSIENLPDGLEILLLGDKFTQPINNLPNSLVHLTIRSKTNIINLPNNLKSLFVNTSIEHLDLSKIKQLKLYDRNLISNSKLQNMSSLEELFFDKFIQINYMDVQPYYNEIIKNLPPIIKKIIIGSYIDISIICENNDQLINLDSLTIYDKIYTKKKLQKIYYKKNIT